MVNDTGFGGLSEGEFRDILISTWHNRDEGDKNRILKSQEDNP